MKIEIGPYPKKDKPRKVKVKLHKYDTWNANHTLALVIVPVLKDLRGFKHGSPLIDDEDVPEDIRSTNADPKEHEWDIDSNHHKRWEWVLNEMIWAFEQHAKPDWEQEFYSGDVDWSLKGNTMVEGPNHTFEVDREGLNKHQERMANGRRLFAKYYDSLWT